MVMVMVRVRVMPGQLLGSNYNYNSISYNPKFTLPIITIYNSKLTINLYQP